MTSSKYLYLLALAIISYLFTSFSYLEKNTANKRLEILCKTWGFLKYHHPEISANAINWDSALMAYIPAVINAKEKTVFQSNIADMIASAPASECEEAKMPDSLMQESRYNWLESDEFRELGITSDLEKFSKYCSNRENKYVLDEIPTKFRESAIQIEEPISEEYALLTLFRYWNAINYFYSYINLMDQSWEVTLVEFIPVFREVKSSHDLLQAVRALNARLDDGHTRVQSRTRVDMSVYTNAPFRLITVGGEIFVSELANDSLLEKYNIKIGDRIVAFNGRKIENVRDSIAYFFSGSTVTGTDRTVNGMLLMSKNDSLNLQLERDGRSFDLKVPGIKLFEMSNYYKKTDTAEGWNIIDDKTAYICPAKLDSARIKEVMSEANNFRTLVCDLRYYPQGAVLQYFVDEYTNTTGELFALIKRPFPNIPGTFYFERQYAKKNEGKDTFQGQLILLVDNRTGSQLEYTAMKLQTIPGTLTIGQHTGGVDGNISYVTLPGMMRAFHSGLGVYYPDSSITQRKGIKIDYEVPRTLESELSREDEVLNRAIEYIAQD